MNDPELKELARDVRNEVHGEYYLAELIEKAWHTTLDTCRPSIRMRIENYLRKKLLQCSVLVHC